MPKITGEENLKKKMESNGKEENPDVLKKDEEKKTKTKKTRKKRKKTKPVPVAHPLEQFGKFRQSFIIEHIETINYVDMANLLLIKPDELKVSVEKMGIKLPIERARKWKDIDLGRFQSLKYCARCQVHCNHGSFFIGIKNCRKCYEKNIKLWVEEKAPIILHFQGE